MDVLEVEAGQFGHVLANVVAGRFEPLSVEDRIDAHGAVEHALKRRRRNPHPVAAVDGPVAVDQVVRKESGAVLPTQPQVATR